MLTFLEEQNPILLAFLATLFTYSVTLIGASIVFLFKKVKKKYHGCYAWLCCWYYDCSIILFTT